MQDHYETGRKRCSTALCDSERLQRHATANACDSDCERMRGAGCTSDGPWCGSSERGAGWRPARRLGTRCGRMQVTSTHDEALTSQSGCRMRNTEYSRTGGAVYMRLLCAGARAPMENQMATRGRAPAAAPTNRPPHQQRKEGWPGDVTRVCAPPVMVQRNSTR